MGVMVLGRYIIVDVITLEPTDQLIFAWN